MFMDSFEHCWQLAQTDDMDLSNHKERDKIFHYETNVCFKTWYML